MPGFPLNPMGPHDDARAEIVTWLIAPLPTWSRQQGGQPLEGVRPASPGFSLNPTGPVDDACAEIVTWLLAPLAVLLQKPTRMREFWALAHVHHSWCARERIPHLSEMLTMIMMQGICRTKVRDVELNRY